MRTVPKLDGARVEALVRAHEGPLRAYLSYLGCPAAQVDDLAQETFLTLLRAPFEERDERATAAWLRRVARNLFLKALERVQREPLLSDPEAAEEAWTEYEGDDQGDSYLLALRRCLAGVTGRAQEVLGLRYRGGLRRAQIAERMEMSESGVNTLLVRARKRLRECVERRLRA